MGGMNFTHRFLIGLGSLWLTASVVLVVWHQLDRNSPLDLVWHWVQKTIF